MLREIQAWRVWDFPSQWYGRADMDGRLDLQDAKINEILNAIRAMAPIPVPPKRVRNRSQRAAPADEGKSSILSLRHSGGDDEESSDDGAKGSNTDSSDDEHESVHSTASKADDSRNAIIRKSNSAPSIHPSRYTRRR